MPKSDRHTPSQEKLGEEVNEDGEAGEGGVSAFGTTPDMD